MKFTSFVTSSRVVLVNVAHIVAAFEEGRETRIVLTTGEAFTVAMPLAQVQAQIANAAE